MVIFHSYVSHYQRVYTMNGETHHFDWAIVSSKLLFMTRGSVSNSGLPSPILWPMVKGATKIDTTPTPCSFWWTPLVQDSTLRKIHGNCRCVGGNQRVSTPPEAMWNTGEGRVICFHTEKTVDLGLHVGVLKDIQHWIACRKQQPGSPKIRWEKWTSSQAAGQGSISMDFSNPEWKVMSICNHPS